MRKLIVLFLIIMCTLAVGCDTRKDKDVEIYTESHYINTTESISVNAFNGYRLVASEIIKNEDGSYSINIKLDVVIK